MSSSVIQPEPGEFGQLLHLALGLPYSIRASVVYPQARRQIRPARVKPSEYPPRGRSMSQAQYLPYEEEAEFASSD